MKEPRWWNAGELGRLPPRWLAVYLGLWWLPSPLGELPWVGDVMRRVAEAKELGARWLSGVLGGAQPLEITFSTGSDRTLDYYIVLLLALVSAFCAALCSLRRVDARWDARLSGWVRDYMRLVLASSMVLYGLAKVFPIQFVMPGPRILTMTVGDLTPEDLMWAFMGASRPYTFFAGAAEVVGGVLLLWRRTTALGATVLLLVMGNVLLMDLCYDVNMKLAAAHLQLAILFLLAPYVPRLARALLQSDAPEGASKPASYAGYAIFAAVAVQLLRSSWSNSEAMHIRHPLHGFWVVQDSKTLHMITIQRGGITMIGRDQSRALFPLSDVEAGRLSLLDLHTGKPLGTLHASAKSPQQLTLTGEVAGEAWHLELHRTAEPRLASHAFSWTRNSESTPR